MATTYYETGRLSDLLLLALIWLAFYFMLRHAEKQAKKEGTTIQCKACANRGGAYRPDFCQNRNCKFHD